MREAGELSSLSATKAVSVRVWIQGVFPAGTATGREAILRLEARLRYQLDRAVPGASRFRRLPLPHPWVAPYPRPPQARRIARVVTTQRYPPQRQLKGSALLRLLGTTDLTAPEEN